jgi:ribose transport system permease protein
MSTLKAHRDGVLRVGLAAVVFACFALTLEGFGTSGNVYSVLESCALIGLVAAGLGVTMLAGEFDLSVASVAACAGVIAVKSADLGLVPAVALATAAGAVYGICQGWAIHRFGISSLVFTLGTFIGVRGLAYLLSGEKTVVLDLSQLPMSQTLRERIAVFSPFSITMLVLLALLWLFLQYTRLGREIYAIGGARRESKAAGVPQRRGLITAFATSAGLASLAGALGSIRAASAAPGSYDSLLLAAVTAALIGGLSLYGGRGSMVGVLIGVLTLQFLISGLSLAGAPFWAANLATGALLLAALVIDLSATGSPVRRQVRQLLMARRQPGNLVAEPSR